MITAWLRKYLETCVCVCTCSFIPRPCPAFRTEKRDRARYLVSHDWRQDRKDGRKGLVVHGYNRPTTAKEVIYQTYLAIGGWLSYTLCVERVIGCQFCKFLRSSNYVMLNWEKILGSPCFSIIQTTESWVGPGNESMCTCVSVSVTIYHLWIHK